MTPHLIHIGLPKAGSTYLQNWFEAHPQLAYRPGGIAGFADVYGISAQAAAPTPGICWRVTRQEGLTAPRPDAGEEWVRYEREGRLSIEEEQARACRLLANLFAGATILIVTRGYRTTILSGYSQYVRTGGSLSLPELVRGPPREYPWRYDSLVASYRSAFGADRVILLPFELLRDAPDRFLRELENRLGLHPFAYAAPPANVAASAIELAWYPHLTAAVRRLAKDGGRLERLYGRLLYRGRLSPLVRLLQRVRPRPPVTVDLVDEAFLDQFRGQSECLRTEPLYAPYHSDYLL
jgi:hypothetical protein